MDSNSRNEKWQTVADAVPCEFVLPNAWLGICGILPSSQIDAFCALYLSVECDWSETYVGSVSESKKTSMLTWDTARRLTGGVLNAGHHVLEKSPLHILTNEVCP